MKRGNPLKNMVPRVGIEPTTQGFSAITLNELIETLKKEEEGTSPQVSPLTTEQVMTIAPGLPPQSNNLTPLDALLSKATNDTVKAIYLRLLGYVIPLNTPTHDALIDAVIAKGFDRKRTEASAVMLSDSASPYIKDTGSHYIVGDKEICTAATNMLSQEFIDMLEGDSDGY